MKKILWSIFKLVLHNFGYQSLLVGQSTDFSRIKTDVDSSNFELRTTSSGEFRRFCYQMRIPSNKGYRLYRTVSYNGVIKWQHYVSNLWNRKLRDAFEPFICIFRFQLLYRVSKRIKKCELNPIIFRQLILNTSLISICYRWIFKIRGNRRVQFNLVKLDLGTKSYQKSFNSVYRPVTDCLRMARPWLQRSCATDDQFLSVQTVNDRRNSLGQRLHTHLRVTLLIPGSSYLAFGRVQEVDCKCKCL